MQIKKKKKRCHNSWKKEGPSFKTVWRAWWRLLFCFSLFPQFVALFSWPFLFYGVATIIFRDFLDCPRCTRCSFINTADQSQRSRSTGEVAHAGVKDVAKVLWPTLSFLGHRTWPTFSSSAHTLRFSFFLLATPKRHSHSTDNLQLDICRVRQQKEESEKGNR